MFHLCLRWFWKEGSELLTYQICQNHVQRLRMFVEVASVPGSRGQDPGAIMTPAHLRPSNPRRESVRLSFTNFGTNRCVSKLGFKPNKNRKRHHRMRAWSKDGNIPSFFPHPEVHRFSDASKDGAALNPLSVITDVMPPLPQAGEESTITSPRPLAGEVDCASAQDGEGTSNTLPNKKPRPFRNRGSLDCRNSP
jgi:hypothetical protein